MQKRRYPKVAPLSLLKVSVAPAAEDKQCDDEHPDPIIAKEMAQTAVIHKSTSVMNVGRSPRRPPHYHLMTDAGICYRFLSNVGISFLDVTAGDISRSIIILLDLKSSGEDVTRNIQ